MTHPDSPKVSKITKEVLQRAAKAAGVVVEFVDVNVWGGPDNSFVTRVDAHTFKSWNPEHNLADLYALARAAKLKLDFELGLVSRPAGGPIGKRVWCWIGDDLGLSDGTEAECIILAAAATIGERV